MDRSQIHYRSGYKYQLVEAYTVKVKAIPDQNVETDFIALTMDGDLTVKKGYAWDGPSGPTIDTKNFMRGSLIHDALYQLMRNNYLAKERWRETADLELKRFCLEDGMSRIRAWWVYRGVRIGGDPAASPEHRKKVIDAP